jgi:hypothetical protein
MTLILSAITKSHTVQVSDRRLTDYNGDPLNDHLNKAISLVCRNGHFCVSATGAGFIGSKPTLSWLAEKLYGYNNLPFRVVDVIRSLRSDLDQIRNQIYHPITVVFAGTERIRTSGLATFIKVTNDYRLTKRKNSEFVVMVPNELRASNVYFDAAGATQALNERALGVLEFAAKKFASDEKPRELMLALARVIRIASYSPADGRLIGRNCMGQYVPHASNRFLFSSLPEHESPVDEAPQLVSHGLLVSEMHSWVGDQEDVPPPWAPFISQKSEREES